MILVPQMAKATPAGTENIHSEEPNGITKMTMLNFVYFTNMKKKEKKNFRCLIGLD